MKPFALLALTLSLGLNAAFAVLLLRDRFTTPPAPAPAVAARPAITPAAPTIDETVWPSLDRTQLADLASQLRDAGFPPAIVQAILAAQINETYSARRKALSDDRDASFWKDANRDPKHQLALRQLHREQQNALRDALGHEPVESTASLYSHKNLDFLPAEKAVDLRRVSREFEERRADLYAAGFNQRTDAAKLSALEKEEQAAIAATLSPAELLEYNLRFSRTANNLREELAAFAPTEQEYRAIYALRAAFDGRFESGIATMTMTREEREQRTEAQKETTALIKASLDPQRAADYERMTDYSYRRTAQLIERLELPRATADQVWTVQKEFEQRRNDLYRANRDRPDLNAQLAALKTEAITRLTPILGGDRGMEAYTQYGGSWIDSLVPRPRPAAPKSPSR